ncbi:DNRLRE domain-containing protein [Candidatus Woesebacteria bacterium]|nr:DNRLRE domain-containing protein [Candidatus Woesebacteria bacterium]
MKRKFSSGIVHILVLLTIAVLFGAVLIYSSHTSNKLVKGQTVSFSFTAGADHNDNIDASASLNQIASSQASFHLALGDLSYDSTNPESVWCNFVKSHVGETFPFQIVSGNHEDENITSDDGYINNFIVCLPDRIGVTGNYGHRYYFDYPSGQPLARFIVIDPNLKLNGVTQEYCKSGETVNCNWLKDRIDEAKTQGLWVIVGMHKVCITMGRKSCEIGADLMNILTSRKVDLVLQGHDHDYQRSKQLICATKSSFNSSCVSDDGVDNEYIKDQGSVFVINGAFGAGLYDVNTTDSEAGYFAVWMGKNSNPRKGVSKYTVSDNEISAQFLGSTTGTFSDNFVIRKIPLTPSATPTFGPSPTPTLTPTPSLTPTPTPIPLTLTFTPSDDASIIQGFPTTNYGGSTSLNVDNSPVEQFLIKFVVSGVNGRPVASSTLRLYNVNASDKGGDFHRVADNTWTEGSVNWNTAPTADPAILTSLGSVLTNTWYEADLSSFIIGDGTYSLKVTSTSSNGADYRSKEGTTVSLRPQLIVNLVP